MSKKLVLCVDGHEDSISFMDFWLTQGGYEVKAATSYSEALKVLQTNKIDLSILEVRLDDGDSDGFDLCKTILAKSPDTKVIFSSGDTRLEIKNRAKESGAKGLFSKPINIAEMESVIQELIGT